MNMKYLYSGLSPEEKNEIESRFVELNFKPKEYLYSTKESRKGLFENTGGWSDSDIWIYFIESWIIKISINYNNRKNTMAFLRDWDFFWEVSTILNFKPTAEVTTVTDTRVNFISWKHFSDLLQKIPKLSINLCKYLAKKIQHQWGIIFDHVFRPLENRVASNLISLIDEFGEDMWSGKYLIWLKITHQELADFVWTNRETVTKILTKFRKMELINFDENRKIVINDIEKMKELLNVKLKIRK